MSFFKELADLGEQIERDCRRAQPGRYRLLEDTTSAGDDGGLLVHGDNLALMLYLLREKGMAGRLQTIYVDPPFGSNAQYQGAFRIDPDLPLLRPTAYADRCSEGMQKYLLMLGPRLCVMRELLAEDGLIWVHLDWHTVHAVKLLMDEIFGAENFINEIIWQYKSGGSSKRHFARKHDTILLYAKSSRYRLHVGLEKSYNRGLKPYRFRNVEEYCDQTGWYTLVHQKDVWAIDMVGRSSGERTGYATQKPEALLRRILEASTEPGDLCADFFCGAGTLAAAAAATERRWICCDSGALAVGVTQQRLARQAAGFRLLDEAAAGKEAAEKGSSGGEVTGHGTFAARAAAEAAGGVSRTAEGKNPSSARQAAVSADPSLQRRLRVELTGWRVDRAALPLREAQRAALEEVDPLCLIVGWSIDARYDGRVHRPQKVIVRKGGRDAAEPLPLSVVLTAAEAGYRDGAGDEADSGTTRTEAKDGAERAGSGVWPPHRISVRVLDVFGNARRRTLTVQNAVGAAEESGAAAEIGTMEESGAAGEIDAEAGTTDAASEEGQ
ncbi:MAG: DNA methyltransferase [Anaerovoracaceae bacterium]|jgi:site-specific DNA-methyltransferase (adenine-specific)